MRVLCPTCGSDATVRTSVQEAPSSKKFYAQCNNIECGQRFGGYMSATFLLHQSQYPRPKCLLPIHIPRGRKEPDSEVIHPPTGQLAIFP